jgi:hypothetical protein
VRVEPLAERHRDGLREAAGNRSEHRDEVILLRNAFENSGSAIVDDDWPAVKSLLERKIDRHVNGRTRSGG